MDLIGRQGDVAHLLEQVLRALGDEERLISPEIAQRVSGLLTTAATLMRAQAAEKALQLEIVRRQARYVIAV